MGTLLPKTTIADVPNLSGIYPRVRKGVNSYAFASDQTAADTAISESL